ncbi:MAG: methyltransferase domain-containing protein [Candidatus Sifarchaeia archaeon]|jgi:SAM-dependent methyltransferase
MIDYSSKQHNWLAYYINNKSFTQVANMIKGIVLDVGCGEQPFKKEIERSSDTYFGVDWPLTFHRKNEIDVYANISEGFPFKSESVDTIVAFQVMEHLAEPENFLWESFRVLRKRGKIILTTPFMWGIHEAPHDYYRYTAYGLRYLLTKTGYKNVHIVPNTGYLIMAGLRLNYHLNRHNKGLTRFLYPLVFLFVQEIALILDRLNFDPTDTASYTATAEK